MSGRQIYLPLLALLCCCALPAVADSLEELQTAGRLEITADISPGGNLVPGQKLTLTLTIATDRWFAGGTRIGIPEVPGLVILQTEQFASNASETRAGQSWVVQRWALDIYPQRAGDFTVPPIPLSLHVNGGESGDLQGRLSSPATRFTTALPPGLENADHWVAAPRFEVSQQFDRSLESLRVGDAFEREVRFEAEDVMAMMLPSFEVQAMPGLAAYPSPPQLRDDSNRGQTLAIRSQRVSYVVEKEGSYRLPEREFFWWDTTRRELRLLSLPAVDILVGGGAAEAGEGGAGLRRAALLLFAGALALPMLAWLGWRFFPRGIAAGPGAWIGRARRRWRALRAPALPGELNPGSSAGERRASG